MRTCLIVVLFAAASPGWAQDLPDAGLPDAGDVGQGGADRDTEEADQSGGPCLDSRDCDRLFTCEAQRCVPVKPVSVGCSAAPVGLFAALGLLALARRRTR
jgi:uncharacterized protein (TIGR03382 family)